MPSTIPSCSARFQRRWNPGPAIRFDQASFTISALVRSGRSVKAAISSCAVLPLYSGSISGCRMTTLPSVARASLHDSRSCASGTCQWQRAAVSSSYGPRWMRQADLAEQISEAQVGWGGERRIAPQDHQELDPSRRHVGRQLGQRARLLCSRIQRSHVDHRCPRRSQPLVHGVRQGVHLGRLPASHRHHRPPAGGLEVRGRSLPSAASTSRGAPRPGPRPPPRAPPRSPGPSPPCRWPARDSRWSAAAPVRLGMLSAT